MPEENDSKYELLDRFRADLKRPVSERYYTEDELISIFDFAGDAMDDYARAEALMLGMRLYPDSAELMSRHAILYRDFDENAFRNFLDDNAAGSDIILRLMHLSRSGKQGDEAVRALEDILLTRPLSDDEEVIRFVQTAHELGADAWLVENLAGIREKVSYLPTLLYEIAMLSNESEPFASVATGLLEELTEIEPYAPEYWTMLGMVYLRDNRIDEARAAVDYALAINPEYVDAVKTRLRTFADDSDSPEVDTLLATLARCEPEDSEIAYLRIVRLEEKKKIADINLLIDSLHPEARSAKVIVMKAIEYHNENVAAMLRDMYRSGITAEEDWLDVAEYAFINNNVGALMSVLEEYESLSGTRLDRSYIDYRILYSLGNYEEAVSLFVNAGAGSELRQPSRMMDCYTRYVLMLLRLGRLEEAKGALDAMEHLIDTEPALPASQVEKYGMRMFSADVKKRLGYLRRTDWRKYDPLGFDA